MDTCLLPVPEAVMPRYAERLGEEAGKLPRRACLQRLQQHGNLLRLDDSRCMDQRKGELSRWQMLDAEGHVHIAVRSAAEELLLVVARLCIGCIELVYGIDGDRGA